MNTSRLLEKRMPVAGSEARQALARQALARRSQMHQTISRSGNLAY